MNYFESGMKTESKETELAKMNTHLALAAIYLREDNKEESKENAELALKISRHIENKIGIQKSCMMSL